MDAERTNIPRNGSGPAVLLLPVTLRCNARCVMCTIWKNEPLDATIELIRAATSDGVLSDSLRYLGITGGEPVLHPDLFGLAKVALDCCPQLSEISFNTNGFLPQKTIDAVLGLIDLIGERPIDLKIYLSVDGAEGVHDRVRGRAGIFDSVHESAMRLREISRNQPRMELALNSVICGVNADSVQDTFRYAKQIDVPINFSLVMNTDTCINSSDSEHDFEIKPEQKSSLIRFFSRLMMAVKLKKGNDLEKQYYQHLLDTLKGIPRKLGCPFGRRQGCLLSPTGDVYACGASETLKLGNVMQQAFGTLWNDARNQQTYETLRTEFCPQCESNCFVHVPERSSQLCDSNPRF